MTKINPSSKENRNCRLWDKFKTFQAVHHISQKQFAEDFGLCSVSNISQYLHGFRPLNLESGLKFAKGLQCPLEDIISPDLVQLVYDAYSAMKKAPELYKDGSRVVKIFTLEQAIYVSTGAISASYDQVHTDFKENEKIIGVRIDSEEMSPVLEEKDLVFVDLKAKPKPLDIVLAALPSRGRAIFRQYVVKTIDAEGNDVFDLVSTNPGYPTLSSSLPGVRILGVVIERRTAFARRTI